MPDPLKRIWTGGSLCRSNPTVDQRPDGGLVFSYDCWRHGECRCSFTLWCEVGEQYKPDFAGFFDYHQIAEEAVILGESPWVCDKLKTA